MSEPPPQAPGPCGFILQPQRPLRRCQGTEVVSTQRTVHEVEDQVKGWGVAGPPERSDFKQYIYTCAKVFSAHSEYLLQEQ